MPYPMKKRETPHPIQPRPFSTMALVRIATVFRDTVYPQDSAAYAAQREVIAKVNEALGID